jgi:hypothetical protein
VRDWTSAARANSLQTVGSARSQRSRSTRASSPGDTEHGAHLGRLNEAIFATGLVSGELLGEPSPELLATMADSEVRLFTLYQSM